MNSTEEQITTPGRPEFDAIVGVAHTNLSAVEQVWAANLNIARACLVDSAEYTRSVLEAERPEQLYQLNATLLRLAIDRALSYQRDIYRVATRAGDELARLGDLHSGSINRNMAAYLDRLTQYAPIGADAVVSAFRMALESANNTLYGMAQDLVEVAEFPDAHGALPAADNAGSAPKNPRKRAA